MGGLNQHAKKVVSDSPGLVDFAIGLVNSVFNLPDGQVIFFGEFEKQKNCEINSALQKAFGLVEMTSVLVNNSFSLPKWQAVKMIFQPVSSPCHELWGTTAPPLRVLLPSQTFYWDQLANNQKNVERSIIYTSVSLLYFK